MPIGASWKDPASGSGQNSRMSLSLQMCFSLDRPGWWQEVEVGTGNSQDKNMLLPPNKPTQMSGPWCISIICEPTVSAMCTPQLPMVCLGSLFIHAAVYEEPFAFSLQSTK